MIGQETIVSLKQKFASGELTPADYITQLHAEISAHDVEIGSYLNCELDKALEQAKNADLSLPLGGVPIAIKDNINTLGETCSCASKYLESYRAPYDATVIEKLLAAGAIPFGRTNLDEFAMGSATENSALKTTKNPRALEYIPGGSSGGSAACVSANLAVASLGSDTGGSIRQPASHCGVVGLKPTYGRVSRYGLVAFASSLDQIGPMTKTVEDAAVLLEVLAGHDPREATSIDEPVPAYTQSLNKGVQGLKIGLPKEYFGEGIDPQIKTKILEIAECLKQQGAEIVEVSLPHTEYAIATYYILAPAEASSNLARFDGVRYGHRSADVSSIDELNVKSRSESLGDEVKRRIILGTYVLSSGYADAYYEKAQKARQLISQDFDEVFANVDALLTPAVPHLPRKRGENSDPLKDYLEDLCAIAVNLAGNCAISVPVGTLGDKNLPIGAQIIAPHFKEETLFQVGSAIESL